MAFPLGWAELKPNPAALQALPAAAFAVAAASDAG